MNADDHLRHAFQELRKRDEADTPLFARVVRKRQESHTLWWRWALAGAAMVAAVLMLHRPQPHVDESQWVKLSNWQSSTDGLLSVSTTPWGDTISTPSDSLGKETYEN
jgi:hypothetical protein